jgi:hypothetical protein
MFPFASVFASRAASVRAAAGGLALALGWALCAAGPAAAQSPTAATTVKNSADDTRLQLNYDGGLYVPGTHIGPNDAGTPADSIPATGAGTRMMWYPAKAAFRAGRVGLVADKSDVWDADSVGRYSVAMGLGTKAQDRGAVALGLGTTAGNGTTADGGTAATAMGAFTTASGFNATAMGAFTTASGKEATAMGQNTTAATNQSLTIGRYNDKNRGSDDSDPTTGPLFVVGNGDDSNLPSSRSDALVLDQSGTLEVSGGVVLPDGTTLEEGSDVSGLPTNGNGASLVGNDDGLLATGTVGSGSIPTSGAGTRMMWYPEKAAFRAGRVGLNKDGTQWDAAKVGDYSVAFGLDTKASGFAATAMGEETTASGPQATAMGTATTASGTDATAMGQETTASGLFATSMGLLTTASGRQATAMGQETTASGISATAMGDGTTAATDRSLSIGECNDANNTSARFGTLLAVGNGSYDFTSESCTSTSDALVLDDRGNLTVSSQNTFSDRRLKTAVEPLAGDVLAKLADLRPVRYEFKDQQTHPAGEQLGLIAQDVQKEFPELVSKGSGGMLSLAYPKLTAVLLKGLQEQQATIDSLKQRVRQVEALQKRVARLEARASGGSIVAGLPGQGLLAVLIGLGGLGAGLLWRRRA